MTTAQRLDPPQQSSSLDAHRPAKKSNVGGKAVALIIAAVLVVLALLSTTLILDRRGPGKLGASDAWQPEPNRGFQSADEVAGLASFLTAAPLLVEGDDTFHNGDGQVPRSFVSDPERFWSGYICGGIDCSVTDVIRSDPYSLLGENLDGIAAARQVERVLATTGANIYDAAVWQMAVALAANEAGLDRETAEGLVDAQRSRLRRLDSRAASSFTYQGQPSSDNPAERYAVRFLGPSFFVPDPLLETSRASLVQTAVPAGDPLVGKITWPDWKPITGENAWAFLIGPLQATFLLNGSDAAAIPLDDSAVLDAVAFLEPLSALQTDVGAVLHAADQSLGNDGSPIPAGTVSFENVISVVAGLRILDDILAAQSTAGDTTSADVERIGVARAKIALLLHGAGTRPGLVTFLRTSGPSRSGPWIVQGGIVSGSTFVDAEANPETADFAVDVNTWGVAALSPATVDEWWGPGASYEIWLSTREKGGFLSSDGSFRGVGYTTNAGPDQQVLSGEWSFGALLMVRGLLQHYGSGAPSGARPVDIAALERDVATMEAAMIELRTDRYHDGAGGGAWSGFPEGIPPEFGTQLPDGQLGFLYSSKRVAIPFGWFGNPIPSTASSAWAMLWSHWYNPFALGGSVGAVDWTRPADAAAPASGTASGGANIVTVVNGMSAGTVVVDNVSNGRPTLAAGSFELFSLSGPATIGAIDETGATVTVCTIEPRPDGPRSIVVTVVDGPSCS